MLICYCIQNIEGSRTYVGATNDFSRRIRQHNGEIAGGAQATSGQQWQPIIHIHGFTNRHQLLHFEWLWKHCFKSKAKGVLRRLEMLEYLLEKDGWKGLTIETTEEWASLLSCQQPIKPLELPANQ